MLPIFIFLNSTYLPSSGDNVIFLLRIDRDQFTVHTRDFVLEKNWVGK